MNRPLSLIWIYPLHTPMIYMPYTLHVEHIPFCVK